MSLAAVARGHGAARPAAGSVGVGGAGAAAHRAAAPARSRCPGAALPACRAPLPCPSRPRPLLLPCNSSGGGGPAGASPAAGVGVAVDETLRVELGTAGARGSLKFDVVPDGTGQAIVCVAVAGGSEADEAGVRAGMRLTAISDPIRRDEVWRLQDRPSLKNIRELLRMRSADTITLEFEPWRGPDLGALLGAGSAAGSAAGSVVSSVDGESIGERMQRQYEAARAAGRTPTAVQKRLQRRKEALEQTSQRDDRPFLLGLLFLFVAPPLVILLVAQGSGYLDSLYTNTLIGLR